MEWQPEAKRGKKKIFFSRLQVEYGPTDPFILDFSSPELGDTKFLFWYLIMAALENQ